MMGNIIPFHLISILSDGKFCSSENLEKYFRISSTALKQYIQVILDWGVDVLSVSGEGYVLLKPIQLLNEKLIQGDSTKKDGCITVQPVVDSTNQYLFNRLDTLRSGDVCISEYQKLGRGRRGKKWFSPFASSLCLSIYWHFKKKHVTFLGLSLAIGATTAKVLHDFGANQVRVKWPNDLYFFNRKLGGILVEMKTKEDGTSQTVIGVGINLTNSSVHKNRVGFSWINLQEIIDSIVDRNMFAIKLVRELRNSLKSFEKDGFRPFFLRWKKMDNFINHPVKLILDDKEFFGISRSINEEGALLIERKGLIKPWIDGEVSLYYVS